MKELLEKQIGPFPLGVWILVIGGGLGIGLYARRHVGSVSSADPGTTSAGGTDTGTVGNSAAGGWQTTPGQGVLATESLIATNEDWRASALRKLLALNYSPTLADSAITKYLTGSTLSQNEQALIDLALKYTGPTPYLVPAPIVNNTPLMPIPANPTDPNGTQTTNPLNNPVVISPDPVPVAAAAPVPAAASVSVPAPQNLPPVGTAVQVQNPIAGDTSTVIVGTTPDGNGYVYGGSATQAALLTGTPVYSPSGPVISDGIGRRYVDANGFSFVAG